MADNGPGRPAAVTEKELYETLRQAEEPFTTVELADIHDTTAQTIRKKTDRLVEFPGVKTKDVGKTAAYWYSTRESAVGGESEGPIGKEQIVRETIRERSAARGVWLDRRDELLTQRPVGGEADPSSMSIYHRMDLWTALSEYLEEMELTWPRVLEDAAFGEGDRLIALSEWDIDEASYRYYTEEISLSYQGEMVSGLGGLFAAVEETQSVIGDEMSDSAGEEIDVERFDKVLPGFEELLHAADAFDEFVCEMHGYGWGR